MGGKPFIDNGLDRWGYRPILKTLSGEKGSELAPDFGGLGGLALAAPWKIRDGTGEIRRFGQGF